MADRTAARPTLAELDRRLGAMEDRLVTVDDQLTERAAEMGERLEGNVRGVAHALGERITQVEEQRLVPLQGDVASLTAAVNSLIGLDGIAQELANLVDIASQALGVVGPPAPPGPGVAVAIQLLVAATPPDLQMGELVLSNASPPYIGDPTLYVPVLAGRSL